jgi:hypothetical protein
MDSSVKARPTHYEVLGVTPAASGAEIAQAFTRKMSAFAARPLATVAQLSIAFETLRDPERRKAYDASLRPPPPPSPPQQPAYTVRWNSGPFMAAAVTVPPARPAGPELRLEVAAEPKPFIASPEPVRTQPPETSSESARQTREQQPQPRPEPFVGQQSAIQRAIERGPAAQPEESPTGLNRTAMTIGGVVLGVGVLGAVAGWSAGLVDQPQPEDRVTVALPRAKPITTAAAAQPAPAWVVDQTRPQRQRQTAQARVERSGPAPRPLPLEELQTDASQSAQIDGEPAVAQTPAAAVVPASLSLPNPVIARTIGRIGYPCGAVASTAAVEGGPGVYKVTCTSGHSYQATSVRGRYHFRRWSGR